MVPRRPEFAGVNGATRSPSLQSRQAPEADEPPVSSSRPCPVRPMRPSARLRFFILWLSIGDPLQCSSPEQTSRLRSGTALTSALLLLLPLVLDLLLLLLVLLRLQLRLPSVLARATAAAMLDVLARRVIGRKRQLPAKILTVATFVFSQAQSVC